MSDAQAALHAKVEYFKQLGSLRVDDAGGSGDDDAFDAGEERERQRCRGFFQKPTIGSAVRTSDEVSKGVHDRNKTPKRVSSAPTLGHVPATEVIKATQLDVPPQKGRLAALLNNDSTIVEETIIPDSTHPASKVLLRSESTPLPPSKRLLAHASEDSPSVNVAVKKRKRDSGSKLRPTEEQIFKGLAFFYVPDNDIAPARRLRINKAKEYGAIWTRDVATATHVVVERKLEYRDVEKFIPSVAAKRHVKVVNEDYPIDCIQFRALVDPHQKKYRLRGQPTREVNEILPEPTSDSGDSVKSLQLKSPQKNRKKWDYAPPIGTPPRKPGTPQRDFVNTTLALSDSQPISLNLGEFAESPKDLLADEDEDLGKELEDALVGQTREQKPTHRGSGNNEGDAKGDELSSYISMMQEFKDLPLDDEEDDDTHSFVDAHEGRPDSEERHSSGSEKNKRKKPVKGSSRRGQDVVAFEDRFGCNHAGPQDAHATNPNSRTIEFLQSMADYYERINDHWRTSGYRKAITTLKRQSAKITTEEEAFRLPNIGHRLAQKIEEIATTNKLQKLEYAEDDPMNKSLELFLGIYGVGTSQAGKWIAKGFRTLEELRESAKLTPNQQVGLDHNEDLNKNMSRREVEALGAFVKQAAARIDPEVELIIGGSYRRGAETSHDIDFIVTKPGTRSTADLRRFLDDLIQKLEAEKFVTARLASSRTGDDGSKWHGCCVLPKIKGFNDEGYRATWRRIDFLLVPEPEMGAALIYFTGDDLFNRSMRLLASKKGMRLNQRGLYRDGLRGKGGGATAGELVEGRDEGRIFEVLGVKWREPWERWC